MIFDAHVHVWELPPVAPIGPTAPTWTSMPDDSGPVELLIEDMDANGVDASLLVQSSGSTWDNTYVAQGALDHPDRFRSIGLIDPLREDNASLVQKWIDDYSMSGFRLHPDYYPDIEILKLPSNARLFEEIEDRGSVVKVHNRVPNAYQLEDVCGKYPGITWVIDHMMYPEPWMAEGGWGEYRAVLKLAEHENVWMMISDVHNRSEEAFPFADMHDAVKLAIDAFGIDRCIWGTGYPGYHRVLNGWLSLADELRLVREGFDWLTSSERDALLGLNAAKLYGFAQN